MTFTWPTKDPSETLDYTINWSALLAGDTIATSTFAVPTGLTLSSSSNTTTTSTAWISGGSWDRTYTITCTITTAGGRTYQRSASLYVGDL